MAPPREFLLRYKGFIIVTVKISYVSPGVSVASAIQRLHGGSPDVSFSPSIPAESSFGSAITVKMAGVSVARTDHDFGIICDPRPVHRSQASRVLQRIRGVFPEPDLHR